MAATPGDRALTGQCARRPGCLIAVKALSRYPQAIVTYSLICIGRQRVTDRSPPVSDTAQTHQQSNADSP